jgi:biotin carboxyl carrier protein
VIHKLSVEIKGVEREVSVEALDGGRYRITCAGRTRVVDARKVQSGARAATWSLVDEGGGPTALVDVDGVAPELTVSVGGVTAPCRLVDARAKVASFAAARAAQAGPLAVRSPMPGKVVKVLVAVGDQVKSGAPVVVVEAMKMENELRAPRDGAVKDVAVKEGQAVEAGQPLVTLA